MGRVGGEAKRTTKNKGEKRRQKQVQLQIQNEIENTQSSGAIATQIHSSTCGAEIFKTVERTNVSVCVYTYSS